MNLSESKFYLDLVQWLVTLALAVTVWLRKPGNDAGLAVAALKLNVDECLADHAHRLTEIEAHMQHMATSEGVARLDGQIKQLSSRIDGQALQLQTISTSLARIESYLLDRGRK